MEASIVPDPQSKPNGSGRLDRATWLTAARTAFIRHGHVAVKVDRLAGILNVTRGSFYWHFKNRDDLLNCLLDDWEHNNSAAIFEALASGGSPSERLQSLGRAWIEERHYSPAYDSAMRDWARVSDEVKTAVHRVDDARIAAFRTLFEDAGYAADEAFIRARVTYFHQVGYYAMDIQETRELRNQYLSLYTDVLLGGRKRKPMHR